jgi:hypothetical protein
MKGIPISAVISLRRAATLRVSFSPSMTQGPAMSTKGSPAPTLMPPTFTLRMTRRFLAVFQDQKLRG